MRSALIIANTEYTDPGLAQLTAPGKDAEDFARVLKDQNLCGFDNVKVLLNQLSSSVIEAIDEFFDQKKPDDMLVLYFSGHGVRDEIGSLYLAFTNTIRTRLRSTAIKADYIKEAMDQSRSKRQVLILDCCNSGAFPQGTKAEVGGVMGLTQAFQGYGRFVLTASDATQFAWEGNKVIGETDDSLFTHFLVKGLEGEADSDGDGKITVDELYDYAYDQISRVTPKQTPTKSASKQEGEIVLRQITRIEDIKPISLPEELIEATEDSRTFVREGAVQQLEKLLKGKNLGLARSAREVLERIEREDDSRRVSQAATQVLEPIRQAEKAEEERKAREEAERLAEEKRFAEEQAEKERLEREKAKAERQARAEAKLKAKKEAERVEAQKAEEERLAREKDEADGKAKEKAQRLAAQKSDEESIAREKVEADRKAKKEAERLLAKQRAEEERKAREEAQRLATLKTKEESLARRKAERAMAKKKAEEELNTMLDAKQERLSREKAENERRAKAKVARSAVIFAVAALLIIAFVSFERSARAPVRLIVGGESPPFSLAGKRYWVNSVAFSPDGSLLAAVYAYSVQIWNVKDRTVVETIPFTSGDQVAFSPDGQTLATIDWDVLWIFRVSDFSSLLRINTNRFSWSNVVFSPTGQYIALGGKDNSTDKDVVDIWQVNDGTLVKTLLGHTDYIQAIAFSLDGQYLASASTDGTVRLWRTSDWTFIKKLNARDDVYSVAFSRDGQSLASGGLDGTMIWRVDDGTKIATLDTTTANRVAFSPDGQKLASGLFDHTILMWRVSDSTLLNTFQGHTEPVYSVAFSPDGKLLASGSEDGTVRLWEINP